MKFLKNLVLGAAVNAQFDGSGDGEIQTCSFTDITFSISGIDFNIAINKKTFELEINSGSTIFTNFKYTFLGEAASRIARETNEDWQVTADAEVTEVCNDTQDVCIENAKDTVDTDISNIDGASAPTLPEPTVSTLDCADGNNGGCSHFCTDNVCSCQTCWTLGKDMKTCAPNDGLVTIECTNEAMNLEIAKCVLEGNDVSQSTLADGVCAPTDGGDKWVVNTDLDQCGTTFNLDSDTQVIDFSNALSLPPTVVNGLVMSRSFGLDFTCEYATEIDDISAERTVIGGSVTTGLTGSGALEFSLTFFTDSAYDTAIEADSTIVVGEKIFFNIGMTRPIDGLVFTVLDCTVTDEAAGESYDILAGQCADNLVGTTIESQSNQSELRFTYTAFQFASSQEIEADEVLSCSVLVCDESDTDTPCTVAPTCARKRRSTDDWVDNASIFKVEAALPKFR